MSIAAGILSDLHLTSKERLSILRNLNARRAEPSFRVEIAIITVGADDLDEPNLRGQVGCSWHRLVYPAGGAFERHIGLDIERFHGSLIINCFNLSCVSPPIILEMTFSLSEIPSTVDF